MKKKKKKTKTTKTTKTTKLQSASGSDMMEGFKDSSLSIKKNKPKTFFPQLGTVICPDPTEPSPPDSDGAG